MATAAAAVNSNTTAVLHALENPEFRWRTIDSVASETNLPRAAVVQVLSAVPDGDLIRTPSKKGMLYTTRSHYIATRTFLSRLLSVVSDMPK